MYNVTYVHVCKAHQLSSGACRMSLLYSFLPAISNRALAAASLSRILGPLST